MTPAGTAASSLTASLMRTAAMLCALALPGVFADTAVAQSAAERGPLQQLTGAVPQPGPGPLELRAKAVTADNPIPNRVHYVSPAYPQDAALLDAAATVVLRLTLDPLGRVGEVRVSRFVLGVSNVAAPPGAPAMPAVLARFAASARTAAAQWVYEPPAQGPLSFDVPIRFSVDGDPTAGEPSAVREAAMAPVQSAALAAAEADLPAWAEGAVPARYLLKVPVKTRHVAPVYPEAARQAGVEGTVLVQARVEADGTIRNARIIGSVGELDQAALDAILQWRFEPPLREGQPIPVLMLITVQFSL